MPGFAAGGLVPAGTAAGIQAQINAQYPTLDQLYASHATQAQINNFWKTVLDPLYAAKDKLTSATTAIANTALTKNQLITDYAKALGISPSSLGATSTPASIASQAKTIASQIAADVNFARNVAVAAVAGQGYGTQGLISGYTVDTPASTGAGAVPPGHPGYNAAAWNAAAAYAASNATPAPSVQDQMKAYLGTEQSFSTDLGSLSKQGLSKALISQLIAAGPTQGDALAQSILGGAGGVKGANSLWNQINAASQKLGGSASQAMYGQHLGPSGGAYSGGAINVNVNVGGGASSGVSLTTAQINQITAQVQAALLKQAKRNRQTGTSLPGKKA